MVEDSPILRSGILETFVNWLRKNEASDTIISVLQRNGFATKLSLSHLSFDDPACSELINSLNVGDSCLLRGLINKAKVETTSLSGTNGTNEAKCIVYNPTIGRTGEAMTRVKNSSLRETIGKLFNKSSAGSSTNSLRAEPSSFGTSARNLFNDEDDFLPSLHLTKRKGKYPAKGKGVKRKDSNSLNDAGKNPQPEETITVSEDKPSKNLESILADHASSVFDSTSEYRLEVDRTHDDLLWNAILGFYKRAQVDESKIRKDLVVEFKYEVGIDSGSLKREFFEDSIKLVNNRLFEGADDRRIIKTGIEMELEYKVAGMLVSHSVLQGGMGFPFLSPCIYEYITSGDVAMCYPVIQDIPLNAATCDLKMLIQKLCEASNDEEIFKIFEEPSFQSILNTSGWSLTDPISVRNKLPFLQHLVHEEVIRKREANLRAFTCGLNCLGFLSLVRANISLCQDLFVFKSEPLTREIFLSLVTSKEPDTTRQVQAFHFFKELVIYLDERKEQPNLKDLLRFITGCSTIPPMGLQFPIELQYQSNSILATLPKSQACFSLLMIPIVHDTKQDFIDTFLKAMELCSDYGSP